MPRNTGQSFKRRTRSVVTQYACAERPYNLTFELFGIDLVKEPDDDSKDDPPMFEDDAKKPVAAATFSSSSKNIDIDIRG
ncbi:hypothetical protein WAI453_011435 [Rhynchosporium graminicola]